ncbi:MAG: (d)CMP kinase [Tenacibaculum sp.]
MTKKIIIAIDGLSSTGKSTIAKRLAKELAYIYIDSGAMYRAVTFYAMQHKFITEKYFDKEHLIKDLQNISLAFNFNETLDFAEIYLNEKNVEKEIRDLKVSKLVSRISAVSEVRKKLVKEQQEMGIDKGLVMDGRDIGSVVFPEAELKLFMTATADKRAKRRYKELLCRGAKVSYDEVLHNIEQRDNLDSTREDSPLVKTKDAIAIDNSNMGLNEQFDRIMSLVRSRASI